MSKSLLNVKVKFDGVSIIDEEIKSKEELDNCFQKIKKKIN
jgi:hypothetical protein